MSQPLTAATLPLPPQTTSQVSHRTSPPRAARAARKPREKNQKQIAQAKELEARLELLRAEFPAPALQRILETAIAAAHRIALSTRQSDRQGVLAAIWVRGCRTVGEICEDEEVGLDHQAVRDILNSLVMEDLIIITEKFTLGCDRRPSHRPELEYHPRFPSDPSLNRK